MARSPRPGPTGGSPMPGPIFHEPVFAEGVITTDPQGFVQDHPSDSALYAELRKDLQRDVVGFGRSRLADDQLWSLDDVYGARGAEVAARIRGAGAIVFHAVGDTGASNPKGYPGELHISGSMAADCRAASDAGRPSFFFHLGDVVYDFGEPEYYYDQFYAAYRNYPGPIIAIPGNHDSFRADVAPDGKDKPDPLPVFLRNFCAAAPAITPEAKSLHRTAMTAPGVYFALDTPFVRVVSLFSNALEDPGVISPEGGKWKAVPDYQLGFLEAQLMKIKRENYAGCVLLAMHHPPFTYAAPRTRTAPAQPGVHAGNPGMLAEIDRICAKVGVYPHAVLSGHAHNYQHYLRTIAIGGGTCEVPFVVCGSGGHHINALTRGGYGADPKPGADVSHLEKKTDVTSKGLKILGFDDRNFGYLRITANPTTLRIDFVCVARSTSGLAQPKVTHSVALDLATRRLAG